jgi:acyl-CoA synthetase (AMP-forming)/AMP-acid ligase II/thioesterase domain-containing protein
MYPQTIEQLVADGASHRPGAVALLAPDRTPLTYRDLARVVGDVGESLRQAGVTRRDRVALVTANGPEAAAAFLGIAAAAAAAPLNPAYRREELEFYLTDLRPRVVVVQDGLDTPAPDVAAALGIPVLTMSAAHGAPAGAVVLGGVGGGPPATATTPEPADVALVLHTSGTTARPKMVPLTAGRLVGSARNVADSLRLTEADRCLNVMPLFHIHGLVAAVLATVASRGSVIATSGFVAPSFFDWLDAFEPSWYTAVPTIHQGVLARSAGHLDVIARRRLRLIRSSSASLAPAMLASLEAAFDTPVIEAYGMTEAAHQMASNPLPPAARKPGSVGRATGIEIAILDAEGRHLPAGKTGEVAIRGATVFDGYEANPDANARSFVGDWFRTGDQGALDEDGYLFLSGRLKEQINRGGEKVSPIEIEEVLAAIPGVAQAVVFAIPDPRLGEEVAAAVVLEDGSALGEHDLQARLAERLTDFKVPRVIRFLAEIPKGPTGKIQRIGMAARLGLGGTDDAPPAEAGTAAQATADAIAPRTALEHDLVAIWAEVLGLERVGVTDDFFALGGDSLLAAIIITRIGDRLDRHDLPLITFLWAPTIERYARGMTTGEWDLPTSPLLPVRVEGRRPPFFLVHIDDVSIGPAALRRTLDPERPLYGLRSMGLEGGDLPPSIDGLAETFLEEIRGVQPAGPYHIGGYCSGGPIAMEIARRLRVDGEEVAFLGLVDPRLDRRRSLRWYAGRPAYYLRRLARHARNGRLRQATSGKVRQVSLRFKSAPAGPLDHDRYLEALAATHLGPSSLTYPGAMVVFASRDYNDSPAFWSRMADHVSWVPLPVGHETIFQGDDGALFATRLSRALVEADAAGRGEDPAA